MLYFRIDLITNQHLKCEELYIGITSSAVYLLSLQSITVIRLPRIKNVRDHCLISRVFPLGLSLQISTLPGATSDDYYEHKTTTVCDVVTTFAGYKREDAQKLEAGVFERLKNTITDRASVNHCVVKNLRRT